MKKLSFSIAFSIFSFIVLAQTGKNVFTLQQAQNYALQHSYLAKNANLDVSIAKQKVKETTAIGLPQINATGNLNNNLKVPVVVLPNFIDPAVKGVLVHYNQIPASSLDDPPMPEYIPASFSTKYNLSGQINVSQLLFDGSYIVGLHAAKSFVQLSKDKLQKTDIEVKDAVAQAYFMVLVAQENKKLMEENKKNIDKTLFETNELFKNGFAEEQDVEQLKLTQSNIDNSLNRATRQVDISVHLLKFQMGMDLSEEIELTDDIPTLIHQTTDASVLDKKFDFSNHIDYKLINTQEQLSRLNLRNCKAKYLPSLSAILNHQQSAQQNKFSFSDKMEWYPSTLLGFSVQIPIFSSFMKSAVVQQAKIDLEKTSILKLQTEQNIKLQTQTARSEYTYSLEQYQNEKKNVELAEKIKNKTLIKYNEGQASSFELSQAESQYLATQANYINSIFQLLNAKVTLDKALGIY